jgi:hypothetical protein
VVSVGFSGNLKVFIFFNPTANGQLNNLGFKNSLLVHQVLSTSTFDQSQVLKTSIFKDSQNREVARFSALSGNTTALELMTQREARLELDKISRSELIRIYNEKLSDQVPYVIPEDLKMAGNFADAEAPVHLKHGRRSGNTLNQKIMIPKGS